MQTTIRRRRQTLRALVLCTSCLIALGCDPDDSSEDRAQTSAASHVSKTENRKTEHSKTESRKTESRSEPAKAPLVITPLPAATPRATAPARLESGEAPRAGMSNVLAGKEVQSPLVIESSLEARGGKWIARWTVRNRSQAPIYLATQLPTVRGGRIVPDPHHIYLRAEGDTLHMTKRLWRIPRAVMPLIQELPFLIRLEPGQSHAGAIRIPPSLRESYPYREGGAKNAFISKVVISFGYFTQDANPAPSKGHPGLFQVRYAARSAQRVVSGTPHAARLMVR
ncbi:MAG: hypothetical protein JKY65_07495 [Planctomycetes bacterium]|nr:hypothetical protein [Planctomycetota bacterium]